MKKTYLFLLGATLIIIGSFIGPAHSLADTASAAISYLQSQPLGPWSIMALSAAGQVPSAVSTSAALASTDTSTAIGLEAPILAMTATNNDPNNYNGNDYISDLRNFYSTSTNDFGNGSALNDDIFGLLALSSAGVPSSDPMIVGTRNFILLNQNTDGGWTYAVGAGSDTNDTAAALMALLATGSQASDATMQNGLNYLKSAQNSDGGFSYDPTSSYGTSTDSESDSWIISAIYALGQDPTSPAWTIDGNNPVNSLISLQNASSGFFEFQAGDPEDSFSSIATAYAVIALSKKYLPVGTVSEAVSVAAPVISVSQSTVVSAGGGGGSVEMASPKITTSTLVAVTSTADTAATSIMGEVLGASTTNPTALLISLEQELIMLEFKAHNCQFSFNKDLFKGLESVDVKHLQMVLNYTSITAVASVGPGSLGQETTYFGNATKNAVAAFQNLFGAQIFGAQNFTSGNGYIDSSTRAFLNGLCANQ